MAFGQAKDTLKFLVGESFWANWHPYNHTAQIGYKIQRNIFDRLVEVQPDMSLKPGLAESWTQVDELTWEFKLRQGVKFHDGQPLTAIDVKASIELASGLGTPIRRRLSRSPPTAAGRRKARSSTTTRSASSRPEAVRSDAEYSRLSPTSCAAADIAKGKESLEKHPNGTGAFKLTADEPNVKTLDRFDDHYRGPAKLRQLTWEFIKDAQTRLNAILAGQADVIDRVVPDQRSMIEASGDTKLISVTAPEIQSIWFRMDKEPLRVESRAAQSDGLGSRPRVHGGPRRRQDGYGRQPPCRRASSSGRRSRRCTASIPTRPKPSSPMLAAGLRSSSGRRRVSTPRPRKSANSSSRTSTRSASRPS